MMQFSLKPFLLCLAAAGFISCTPSDSDIRENVIESISNNDIMVDVTKGHVTLSGFIFKESDSAGYLKKILAVKGVKSLENNISLYVEDHSETDNN